ncbi:hypothetical protein RJ639_007968 [Escallonia herrerae]|uniref:F-box domain-containing protein n=1 Tax=Escallonia herrerae TaxID=1293975 RepID=A0AA89ATR4_9ASTE|nr:hypothetical protein RJ639_007968 [Escallonia herrerae]
MCLPTDILVNVLSRLLVKVLCQFRCVSKERLKLISFEKHFIDSHRKTSLENPVLLFAYHYAVNRSNKEYSIGLSSVDVNGRFASCFRKPDDSSYSFFSVSCAGLVCMFRFNTSIRIINPSIQEIIKLPSHCGNFCEISVGFGFLESRNEYPIATLLCWPNNSVSEVWCEFFDLKEGEGNYGSCRNVGNYPFHIFDISSPTCSNGTIYWLGRDKNHIDNRKIMIALDLEKEEFNMVEYPEHYSSMAFLDIDIDCLSLVELKGCLCLVDNSSENLITDVWMLQDPKSQAWVKEYSIGFSALDDLEAVRCYPMDVREELFYISYSRNYTTRKLHL